PRRSRMLTARSGSDAVVVTVVPLFVGFGSDSAALTLTLLVSVATAVAVATTVITALPPGAMVPRPQLSVAALRAHGTLDDTNVASAGSTSVSVTPLAEVGPLFVTVTV